MEAAYIVEAVRTPRGRSRGGALVSVHPHDLVVQVMQAVLDRAGIEPDALDDVVLGTVTQFGDQGSNLARLAILAAGWDPRATTGVTLNRFCGSGQTAVNMAAMGVLSGMQDAVLAGGVESLSRVPMGSDKGGLHGHDPGLNARHPLVPQGVAADLIAAVEGFGRDDLDRYALESQRRAAVAVDEGRLDAGLVPVRDGEGNVLLARDEHPRPSTTLADLAALTPSFADAANQRARNDPLSFAEKVAAVYPDVELQALHTAGSSSGLVDGAAAMLVVSPAFAKAHGLRPRARIVSMSTAADEPVIMLTAPTPATERCLARAGMTIEDIDLFEVNEAFAAIPMKFCKDLDVDPAKVNVNGGAIAFGHPFGATGCLLIGAVLDELERTDRSTGLVTMCIGTGQATATVIERV